jgi:hypothetical protein
VSVAEFSDRGATEAKQARTKGTFLAEVHIIFFRQPLELQSKRHHWKITTYYYTYLHNLR